MEIRNKTVIDKKIFVSFQRLYVRLFKKHPAPNIIFLAAILAAAVACIVFSFVENSKGLIFPAFLMIMCAVSLFLMWFVFPNFNFKRNFLRNVEINYAFSDDKFGIKIKDKSRRIDVAEELAYNTLCKVYDVPGALYIFIAKNQAFLVSKSGFSSESDCNEVCAKLSSVLGKKYIKAK